MSGNASGRRQFVDTNVLVYAHDVSAGNKRAQARSLPGELWDSGEGCLSVQDLQEFFVTVTRKVPQPLKPATAALIVSDFSRWRIHSPGSDDVLEAIELHGRSGVSFRDAMILQSAGRLGCEILYSEDMNDGQQYGGVRVCNPFSTG
jgi:predicted nucleic acid-binding protein